MKEFLKNILPKIIKFSKKLDNKSILCDYPWIIWETENALNQKKIIFKKDNEIIYSDKGNVIKGKWEYLPSANSLYIEYGEIKKLCNQAFIDDFVLLLKIDSEEEILPLVNESKIGRIKDFKIYKYLNNTFPYILPEKQKEQKSIKTQWIKPPIKKLSENEKCKQLIKEYKIKNSQARILLISIFTLLLVLTSLYFLKSNIGLLIFIFSFLFMAMFFLVRIFRNKKRLEKLGRKLEKINKITSP
jgi:hypothetical protein